MFLFDQDRELCALRKKHILEIIGFCAILFMHNVVHINMHACFSSRCLKVMFFSICVKLYVAVFCVILGKKYFVDKKSVFLFI